MIGNNLTTGIAETQPTKFLGSFVGCAYIFVLHGIFGNFPSFTNCLQALKFLWHGLLKPS